MLTFLLSANRCLANDACDEALTSRRLRHVACRWMESVRAHAVTGNFITALADLQTLCSAQSSVTRVCGCKDEGMR